MLDSVFTSVAGSTTDGLTSGDFLLCSTVSLVLGLVLAFVYMFRHRYNKNFVVTLALLPFIVQMVIALVNGNIGAGIAVMGVFNLVRFRSIPGTAKDIGSVFLAMAIGLATGMGYITLALLFTVISSIAQVVYVLSPLGVSRLDGTDKTLKVSIPEDLDYCSVFDDLFMDHTTFFELVNVKTTNMGSLYQLEYRISLKDPRTEKRLLDEIRCRNGNLTVSCGRPLAERESL